MLRANLIIILLLSGACLAGDSTQLEQTKQGVFTQIEQRDYAGAESAILQMKADFAKNAELPSTLYMIAKKYSTLGESDKSSLLYREILDDYQISRRLEVICRIKLRINEKPALSAFALQTEINEIFAEYAVTDEQALCEALIGVGDEYYIQAELLKRQGDQASQTCYLNAVTAWDKICNNVQKPKYQSYACFYSAIVYWNLGCSKKSLANFKKIVKQFPDSHYAAYALFKIGRIHQKDRKAYKKVDSIVFSSGIGDPNEVLIPDSRVSQIADPNVLADARTGTYEQSMNSARDVYKLLIENYPDSPCAEYAIQWLKKNNSK